MAKNFVACCNETEARVWCLQQLPIFGVGFIDQYGDPLPDLPDGRQFLPEELHIKFTALQLVSDSGVDYQTLLDMEYGSFIELLAVARAGRWTPATRAKYEKYL